MFNFLCPLTKFNNYFAPVYNTLQLDNGLSISKEPNGSTTWKAKLYSKICKSLPNKHWRKPGNYPQYTAIILS